MITSNTQIIMDILNFLLEFHQEQPVKVDLADLNFIDELKLQKQLLEDIVQLTENVIDSLIEDQTFFKKQLDFFQ